MTDVAIQDQGTIVVFAPLTVAARRWLREHVQSEPYQWLGGGLCVEHRFARDLYAGMIDAGFSLEAA